MHSAIQFQHEYPEWSKKWFDVSEYIAFLSVKNIKALHNLTHAFKNLGIEYSAFFEPDIGNELTAITLEPTERARRMCSNLPLALKEFNKSF